MWSTKQLPAQEAEFDLSPVPPVAPEAVVGDVAEASGNPPPVSLLALLREDRRTNGFSVWEPGFQAIAVYRFGVWAARLPKIVQHVATPLYTTMYTFVRNVYGIELPRTVKVGRRVRFGHQNGVVIHPFAEIGDDCLLRHNVTLAGYSVVEERWLKEAPKIGRGVLIGAGAAIMGAITIGDGARIGPNVVVTRDVPAGSVVMADPPRVISPKSPEPRFLPFS